MESKTTNLVLPDSVYAPEQIEAYILELDGYATWLRMRAVKARIGSATPSADEPSLASELVGIISSSRGDQPVGEPLIESVSQQLKAIQKTAPIIHITLAALPSLGLKHELVHWTRANLHPQMLVSFRASAVIGGGLIVRTRNHIYDLSFKKQIWENRAKLPAIIRGASASPAQPSASSTTAMPSKPVAPSSVMPVVVHETKSAPAQPAVPATKVPPAAPPLPSPALASAAPPPQPAAVPPHKVLINV